MIIRYHAGMQRSCYMLNDQGPTKVSNISMIFWVSPWQPALLLDTFWTLGELGTVGIFWDRLALPPKVKLLEEDQQTTKPSCPSCPSCRLTGETKHGYEAVLSLAAQCAALRFRASAEFQPTRSVSAWFGAPKNINIFRRAAIAWGSQWFSWQLFLALFTPSTNFRWSCVFCSSLQKMIFIIY